MIFSQTPTETDNLFYIIIELVDLVLELRVERIMVGMLADIRLCL